jgi:hypothetical protein
MSSPILTDQIIDYISSEGSDKHLERGIGLFVAVFFFALLRIIFQSHVYYTLGIIGYSLSNTLSLLIY